MGDNTIRSLSNTLICKKKRASGIVPKFYTEPREGWHCGPVCLWPGTPRRVLACPWCVNRLNDLPIPRPYVIRCRDCLYFRRKVTHPHLGHCDAGMPEPVAGMWDDDRRDCGRFLPQRTSGAAGDWWKREEEDLTKICL